MSKIVYEAVLIRQDGDDFEVEECSSLKEARIKLKKMIDNKPYHDAYIRGFEYFNDYGGCITKDYSL